MKHLIDKLYETHDLSKEEFVYLLQNYDQETSDYLFSLARTYSEKYFDKEVYIRGLIEFTNYCKNDCYYCGIRRGNGNADRYRLSKEEILSCCKTGHELGFRTFVLQGGEDPFYTDEIMVDIIKSIREGYPDCAITLSIGEKTYDQYLKYYEAGADRYLLRHETANEEHYAKLHPGSLSLSNRKECLRNIKKIGYQVGTGFMVGSPYQTPECLAQDLAFIKELSPQMVGIGPFIPHKDTPFGDFSAGSVDLTLFLIGILRLMLPNALLPSTTALGTLDPKGREKGILSGSNVLMPNLSPIGVRKKYDLYDNKICTGEEAAECNVCLRNRVSSIGYKIVEKRGDFVEDKTS
ncbi:[FeFe] hydrogenase H-cluster radical SAM maturase HydE [Lacrimispora algidixylanolytica]|uniref:[FeFe] hydrogenase H-cluster radical SAM maturase HydE n=1 Tax=Lacrimispora algidixylanolytica TaxID=94868 RepID=A0A419TBX4_9FIRM|nr:[FeFe] hydrogenase H-cluster radical SAM maturase HydE [Lacrimispora algidixylanolytica]RKD34937.1 [FeFe] hydrogenase H-cluster radical SAM maturase HydE [Lacrimispora algidixylanolytica]